MFTSPPSSCRICCISAYMAARLASSVSERAATSSSLKRGLLPERVVPGGIRGIGRGHHPVDGRAAAPVGGNEGLLQPDIVPVAVIRLPDDVDVDVAGLGMLLPQDGGVDGAREGGIGDREVEREACRGRPSSGSPWPCPDRRCGAAADRRRTSPSARSGCRCPTVPWPRNTFSSMSSRLIECLMARRTLTSSKGFCVTFIT